MVNCKEYCSYIYKPTPVTLSDIEGGLNFLVIMDSIYRAGGKVERL